MKYDNIEITASEDFVQSLKSLLKAQMKMMRDNVPDSADCWVWGEVRVKDSCDIAPFEACFGDEGTKPDHFPEGQSVAIILYGHNNTETHYG